MKTKAVEVSLFVILGKGEGEEGFVNDPMTDKLAIFEGAEHVIQVLGMIRGNPLNNGISFTAYGLVPYEPETEAAN